MKFFLDNCLAIRHARALNEMVKPDHAFTHLQEKFSPDTKDEDWIRKLGGEGNWIVISGDYRIGKNAHERAAWHQSGLTVFFLSKGWTNIPPLQQHSKLALILNGIIEHAEKARPGSGFSISINGKIEQVYTP
jgi:predicted nuclease of predicted toxin-antitoxin system